jgi:hypothetical protein
MGFVGSRGETYRRSSSEPPFRLSGGKEFRPFGAERAYLNCMIRANDSGTEVNR